MKESSDPHVLLLFALVALAFALVALIYLPAHIEVKRTRAGWTFTFTKEAMKDNLFAVLVRELIGLFRR